MIVILSFWKVLILFNTFATLSDANMQLDIRITMNEHLYVKDPYDSVLGRKIVREGLLMINKLGFEAFTFKKLAKHIGTTEAGIYRYFENKHRLLIYLISWYWSYTEYQISIHLNNITNNANKISTIINLLVHAPTNTKGAYIPEADAYRLVLWEASKAYLTRNVTQHNKEHLFKPYKDLCSRIAEVLHSYNPSYKYPHSLASTILDISHSQKFFMLHLPSLTNFKKSNDEQVCKFIEDLVLRTLKK